MGYSPAVPLLPTEYDLAVGVPPTVAWARAEPNKPLALPPHGNASCICTKSVDARFVPLNWNSHAVTAALAQATAFTPFAPVTVRIPATCVKSAVAEQVAEPVALYAAQ